MIELIVSLGGQIAEIAVKTLASACVQSDCKHAQDQTQVSLNDEQNILANCHLAVYMAEYITNTSQFHLYSFSRYSQWALLHLLYR